MFILLFFVYKKAFENRVLVKVPAYLIRPYAEKYACQTSLAIRLYARGAVILGLRWQKGGRAAYARERISDT